MVQVLILNTNINIFDNTATQHGEFTALEFWNNIDQILSLISNLEDLGAQQNGKLTGV